MSSIHMRSSPVLSVGGLAKIIAIVGNSLFQSDLEATILETQKKDISCNKLSTHVPE